MKLRISKWSGAALCCAVSVALLGTLLYAASAGTSHIPINEKVKVTGVILSRSGDTIQIKDKKSGQFVVVNITDNTKIERKKGHLRLKLKAEAMQRVDSKLGRYPSARTNSHLQWPNSKRSWRTERLQKRRIVRPSKV